MEALAGVSLAGNLVQFIDFSCTLVSRGKKLYRNGSLSDHSDLEKVTQSLIDYNRRLRESLELRQSSADGPTGDEKILETIATDCTQVAEQLLERIPRLKHDGRPKLWKSFRAALKSVWSKAEIDAIATRLATYRQQLILQNQEINLSSTCNLIGSLDKKIDPLSNQLKDLSKLLTATQFAGQAVTLPEARLAESAEPSGTESNAGNNISTGNRDGAAEGKTRFGPPHSSISSEQFNILQDLIQQVLVQVQVQPIKSPRRSVSPTGTNPAEATSILRAFRDSYQHEAVEAPSTCEAASEFSRSNLKRKRAPEGNNIREVQAVRGVKRIRGLLNSAQSIAVNSPVTAARQTLVEGKYDRTCDYRTIRRPEGTIGLLQRKRSLRRRNKTHADDARDLVFEYFSATFDYIPNGQIQKFKITAEFQQYIRLQNFTSLLPRLTYSAMVPDDAEIITRVKSDDVRGIQSLLNQGLASLTDCDSEGRPLLYYALSYIAPAVCKYLVDNKADVDAFVTDDIGNTGPILACRQVNDFECCTEELAITLSCRSILLQGGADPSLRDADSAVLEIPAWDAFSSGNYEYVKMILDLAGDFINLEDREEGYAPLLLASEGWDAGLSPDILDLLIRRGADPLQRDLLTGDTCLHRIMGDLCGKWSTRRDTRNTACLVILIRAGLGLFDENYDGVTPWDLARRLCFVPRKLFKDALTECAIDSTGLYIDGEECPAIPKLCFCDTISRARSDREDSHQFQSMNEYGDSDEVSSEQSESVSARASDFGLDQSIEETEDNAGGSYFDGAIQGLNLPLPEPEPIWDYPIQSPWTLGSRSNFAATPQHAYQEAPSYQIAADSSNLPTLDFLSTSSQYDHIRSPTSLSRQPLNTHYYMSRNSPLPDMVQARRLHTVSGQHSSLVLPDLLQADSERQYTYSSTLAWASNSGSSSEIMEPRVDDHRCPSTATSGYIEDTAMSDI